MLKPIILALGLCGAMALTAGAADKPGKGEAKKKAPRTAETHATLKELKAKYDTDKDGKLSKEERAAISADDKAKLEKIQGARKKAKAK